MLPKTILTLAVIAALVLVYLRWVRPYLRSLPSFAEAWQQEATAWAAFKAWAEGRKTILAGIWGEVIAFGPDLLQSATGFDFKTLLGLPDFWAAYVTAMIPVLMAIFRAKANAAGR